MAFCPRCGANVPDGTAFCPTCGAQMTFQEAPVQTAGANEAAKSAAGSPCLVLGILSLVFSGIVGFILSIVGKSKVRRYEQQFGPATGKAKAGKILCTLGLVFSIIAIVFSIVAVIIIIFFTKDGQTIEGLEWLTELIKAAQ